ncbi:dTDP-4-dehydrorhamnose reductase [Halobellus clavatus]|uniref:dTDP-4-dehydrorhamnose reductase n=1 Tax=Halobellus clavatus TaxID=660517 RepID=A0A1H3KZ75_9EURY|nr:dTDP-4-dehydrorhamnose reductase [Halobellus clavatus]SDY57018.1 dTDP-4-dehydrorhamnose reductase [Halobellus clavatus]
MRVFVIGGSGLVGSNIVEQAESRGDTVRSTHLDTQTETTDIELDKTNAGRTQSVIADFDPDVIVDTAAFHAVDDCETKRDQAWSVNAAGTRNVATAANEAGAHLIYLSTDYVFPGDPEATPYTESDRIQPINYYAETKYAGERAARIADEVTILRPSVIYGTASQNFVTWALGELEDNNELTIVNDQISSPTYAPDLAKACLLLGEEAQTGLYHSTGPESMSRYEFTVVLAEVCGYDTDLVKPITTEEFGQEAPRPTDSTLDSSTLYDAIDYEFRDPASAFEELR